MASACIARYATAVVKSIAAGKTIVILQGGRSSVEQVAHGSFVCALAWSVSTRQLLHGRNILHHSVSDRTAPEVHLSLHRRTGWNALVPFAPG